MKLFILSFLIGILAVQAAVSQYGSDRVNLDIMAAALQIESLDSVPLKVSVPGTVDSGVLTFSVADEESGKIFITGTPYDSLGIAIPNSITLTNQYGEGAELQKLRVLHGPKSDLSSMKVLSPSGCTKIQVPAAGRVYLRLGGEIPSEHALRGIFTGSVTLNCGKKS